MDSQYNDQQKKGKRTNNDLQSIIQKAKDRATRTILNPGVNSCAPEEYAIHAPHENSS